MTVTQALFFVFGLGIVVGAAALAWAWWFRRRHDRHAAVVEARRRVGRLVGWPDPWSVVPPRNGRWSAAVRQSGVGVDGSAVPAAVGTHHRAGVGDV